MVLCLLRARPLRGAGSCCLPHVASRWNSASSLLYFYAAVLMLGSGPPTTAPADAPELGCVRPSVNLCRRKSHQHIEDRSQTNAYRRVSSFDLLSFLWLLVLADSMEHAVAGSINL